MELTHIIWLALVQGLTEFLPVSSSAHLILVPRLLAWPDQGIAFDVAVHLGTLIAVVAYFRRDIVSLFLAWIASITKREMSAEARLAWGVILGTIPAGIVGLVFKDVIEVYLRSPLVIAATTIIFGLLLWFADRRSKLVRNEYSLKWQDFLVIGGAPVEWTTLGLGTVIAAASAFVCIHYFLAFINKMGMTPFVIYRLLLGALLLWVFL